MALLRSECAHRLFGVDQVDLGDGLVGDGPREGHALLAQPLALLAGDPGSMPVQKPTSCMFGGPDLATLYVTTAIWDLDGAALAKQPWAGGLLAIDVGVKGLPEPRFNG